VNLPLFIVASSLTIEEMNIYNQILHKPTWFSRTTYEIKEDKWDSMFIINCGKDNSIIDCSDVSHTPMYHDSNSDDSSDIANNSKKGTHSWMIY